MNNKNRHFFASALTCGGFLSFWPDLFKELKRLYLLQGSTPRGQSLVIRMLGLALEDRGLPTNYFHRAEDPMVLEGLTASSRAFGVLCYDHPCANRDYFLAHLKVSIVELPGENDLPKEYMSLKCEKIEHILQSAREIHNSFYPGCSAQLETEVIKKAAGWIQEFQERESNLKRYFAGSVTALGEVDLLNHILCDCRKRYVIKGSPGMGSEVMQEILVQALSCNHKVKAFHSWIEPKDRVVLFFPEIQVAVVDLTCCYNDISSLPGDIVWDLGKDERMPDHLRKAGKKLQEIKSLLAQTGRDLDVSQEEQEKEGICFIEGEINEIISRVLKETAENN